MNIKLHSFAPMKDIDRIVPWKPKYVVGVSLLEMMETLIITCEIN